MKSRPVRSLTRKISGIAIRPVASQSSAGVRTGISISWPPIASISSRMICSILRWTRQPRGVKDQRPAETWRMNPPRTSSLWLSASASPGSSRSVGMKSWEARIASTLGRALGRFGHEECGGLCQLEPLRTLHAPGDPRVDLVEELVDEDIGGDLLQHTPVRVDEPGVAAAGDSEIGVPSLPRAIHGAAHDGDLEGLWIALQALLDRLGEIPDADVVAAAGRAGDHHGPALAQTKRLQDLPGDLDLFDRVGRQRDPDRVADAVHEERPDSDRALDR